MEAEYNGNQKKVWYGDFLYDSMLEAKWAKFFDDVGILFTPHPAKFRTGKYFENGVEIVYTPDFYLREYNVFCEVKPSNELLEKYNIQRKISAAMDNHCSSVGNGLLILGPMRDIFADEKKKFIIEGDFYRWIEGSIVKSYWKIGKSDNGEAKTTLFIAEPEWGDDEIYSKYPYLSQHPSVYLYYSPDDIHASPAVYRALFSAIYADQNGIFHLASNENSHSPKSENDPLVYYPDIPDIPNDLPFK